MQRNKRFLWVGLGIDAKFNEVQLFKCGMVEPKLLNKHNDNTIQHMHEV